MEAEHFKALEEKVNQLIKRYIKLKEENRELMETNRRLEEKIQTMQGELEETLEEKHRLNEKLESSGNMHGEQIKNRVEELLSKVEEVVEG